MMLLLAQTDGFSPYAIAWFFLFAFSTIGLVVLTIYHFHTRDTLVRANEGLRGNVDRLEKDVQAQKRLYEAATKTPGGTGDPKDRRRHLQLALAQKRQEADNIEEEIEELRAVTSNKITKETIA